MQATPRRRYRYDLASGRMMACVQDGPVTRQQALEALEHLDVFAGIALGTRARALRDTLRQFIDQHGAAPGMQHQG
jgi:hypothetical protein